MGETPAGSYSHHDSRTPRLARHWESARCETDTVQTQCELRRLPTHKHTTRRSLQHRSARHHTLHRQDSLGRTHAPVQRNRRYREARPKLRTMCCGRCHANRAAGPGASRDEIAAAAPRALVPRCAPLAPRQGRSSACGALTRSAAGRAHKNAPPLDVSAASKATDATSDMRDATVRRLDGSLRPQGQPRRPP